MPAFLKDLAQLVESFDFNSPILPQSNIASEHGGERARLTNYGPDHLIAEYQLFRTAMVETLNGRGVKLQQDQWRVIHWGIDDAIRVAVTAFALVQTEIREQFMATMTHDLRSPLNGILVGAQMIQRKTKDPSLISLSSKIISAQKRIDRMVQALLDSILLKTNSKLELSFNSCTIEQILEEMMGDLRKQYGDRLKCQTERITGVWDCDALTRAIENLIGNAFKYGDADGEVSIKVKSINGRMILNVHNFGGPIPVEEQEDIFQIYRRSIAARQGNRKGWGLGLPLVRAVAEGHGGSVGVDSDAIKGTTFTFDIPLDSRPYQNAPVTANL